MKRLTLMLTVFLLLALTASVFAGLRPIPYDRQIERYPAVAWQEGEEIKVAVANNTEQEREFDIKIGARFLNQTITEEVVSIEIPPRSVMVKSFPAVDRVVTEEGMEFPARLIFIVQDEEEESIRIQKGEDLNYGFSSFVVPSRSEAQLIIFEPEELAEGDIYYSIADKYTVEARDYEGKLGFEGISSLGLEAVSRSYAEEELNRKFDGHVLRVKPKGAIFSFETLRVENAKLGSISIERYEKRPEGIRRGRISSPQFMILGEDMELIN